ncbi:MAG TPA: FkbM family methyltransferase [Opitutaceae bacterium]|nr:FkbM family methyltransferase [Opitutaceae bacterium]
MATSAPAQLYAQETEFTLLDALLPVLRSKAFLDIGAEKGSFARFLLDRGCTGAVFEPFPGHQQELAALAARTGVKFFPCAVDRLDRTAQFHIAADDQGRDVDYYHSLHKIERDDRVKHQRAIDVPCRSLASLAAAGEIPTEIGILKTDTEGNDLAVMQGLGPVQAEVLICEFFTEGLYRGWDEAHPRGLIARAEQLGFSQYVAIKRWEGQELVSLKPAVFLPRQWGNLVFMRLKVFRDATEAVQKIVAASERRLFESVAASTRSAEEKEAVIQKLLAEKRG